MSTYQDKIDMGGLAINISLVDEEHGCNVTVWPEFENPDAIPQGLQDVIVAWCSTDQAQNWALKQDPSNTDGD